MDQPFISAFIAGGSAIGGAVAGAILPALVENTRTRKELELVRAQLGKVGASYQQLSKNYDDILNKDLRDTSTRRLISFQLLAIDALLLEDKMAGRSPILEILGINSLGPLHQGRELVSTILSSEKDGYAGKIRVLLLDPDSKAFLRREDFEDDKVGRLVAEMCASLRILADVRENVGSDAFANLEIRLHDSDPDRSLVMLNVCATEADETTTTKQIVSAYPHGVILENPYPALSGARGLIGGSHKWTLSHGREYYENDLRYFRRLWSKNAKPIPNETLLEEALRFWALRTSSSTIETKG